MLKELHRFWVLYYRAVRRAFKWFDQHRAACGVLFGSVAFLWSSVFATWSFRVSLSIGLTFGVLAFLGVSLGKWRNEPD